LIGTPVLIVSLLLFGGGQVQRCLGLYGCGTEPAPILRPVIGTASGIVVLCVVLVSTWVVVAGAAIRYLWSADRTRLLRIAKATAAVGIATALVGAGWRFFEGARLRVVAEDAGLLVLGALIVTLPPLLAWAVLTVGPSPSRAA
jgi:hypothetical protein